MRKSFINSRLQSINGVEMKVESFVNEIKCGEFEFCQVFSVTSFMNLPQAFSITKELLFFFAKKRLQIADDKIAAFHSRSLIRVECHLNFIFHHQIVHFQMKTTQQLRATTSMSPKSESSSLINLSHKNTVTITFQQLNIGESVESLSPNSPLTFDLIQQCIKFHSIVSIRTISSLLELFLSIHRPPAADS